MEADAGTAVGADVGAAVAFVGADVGTAVGTDVGAAVVFVGADVGAFVSLAVSLTSLSRLGRKRIGTGHSIVSFVSLPE